VVAAGYRRTGVACLSHSRAGLSQCQVASQGEHRASRHEYLAHQSLVEIEGAVDDLSLLWVQALVAGDEDT